MRLLLLSKSDLFGSLVLNRLLPALCANDTVAVALSDRIFPNERGFPATDRFMHYTRDLPLERFFPAVDAAGGDPAGTLLTFSGLEKKYGLEMSLLGSDPAPARAAMRRIAAGFRPDVILCCRHDFIVPPDVFRAAPLGAYNTHSGEVPYYRGPFCSFWSMLNGDSRAGCSLHFLNEKIDAGDIVDTAWIEIDHSASVAANLVNLYGAGVDLFLELAPRFRFGPLPAIPQPPGVGRYYPQPDAADCREFARRGGRLVDPENCRTLLERYLPAGSRLEDAVPDWKWEGE